MGILDNLGGGFFGSLWGPVVEAIQSGQFDPQGANNSPAAMAMPQPQFAGQPGMVGGVPRSQLPPMGPEMGQVNAQAGGGASGAALPQAPAGPGFLDRLMGGLSANSNALIGLGSDISRGGFTKGFAGLQQGSALDESQRVQQQARMGAIQFLISKGMKPAEAIAMSANPLLLKTLIERSMPEFKPHNVGDVGGSFNPVTGAFTPQFAAPKTEKVGPGDKLLSVTPSVSGLPGGGVSEIAAGGPEKPPAGFDYVNPANPSAGLKPIPGGPATQMTGDVAGRLGLLQAAKPGLAAAKEYFLSDKFKSGAVDATGKAIGQATNSFEISRQRRSIELAAEAALRVATGATAPPDEVKRYANFYTPSVYDSRETRRQKIEALERFLSHAESNMGAGRMPPPETFMKTGGSDYKVLGVR